MIEVKAFQKCTSLKSVELSNSIRTIDGWAFYLCDSLKDIYFDGTKEEWSSINFGPRWLTTECMIHCKDGDVIVNEAVLFLRSVRISFFIFSKSRSSV